MAPALLLACTFVGLALFARPRPLPSPRESAQPLAPLPPAASASVPPLVAIAPPAGAGVSAELGQMHGGPKRQHRASALGPQKPVLRWKTAVSGPVAAQITTNTTGTALYVTTLAGELLSLGPDGVIRWRKNLGGRVYSAPTVSNDGTLFVGSDRGKLVAFRENGDEAWTFDASDEVDTAPLLRPGGGVVFTAGKALFALRPNGTAAFRARLRKKSFASVAEAAPDRYVVAAQDQRVRLFDDKGTELWSVAAGGDVDGGPVVADSGEIFVGTDGGEVLSLAGDGAIRWRAKVGGFVRGALSLARNGDVLVGTYGPKPRMLRLAGADGHVVGEFDIQGTGAKEFGIHGGPLEDAAGNLFFGTQDDHVYAIGPEGLRWKFATGGDVDAPLTLLPDGTLLVGSYDGFVYALHDPF
ncbi:MAG: PQQ-binding-like beta-propeller repeat protein [Polyangiaceae bacterium]